MLWEEAFQGGRPSQVDLEDLRQVVWFDHETNDESFERLNEKLQIAPNNQSRDRLLLVLSELKSAEYSAPSCRTQSPTAVGC